MTTRVAPTETQTAVNTLSNSPVGKIIVVDDEPELKNILVAALSAQGFEVTGCSSAQQALAELRQKEFDLLLTDLMMPEMDGIALLEAAAKIDPQLIGIMMTGQGTIQTAVDAMKLGAFDYVLKPFRLQTVLPVLTRAINTRRLRMENLQLRETVAIYSLCQTIAFTLDPQTVLSKLADAALQQSDADEVSILLPTSDGKELYVAAVRGEKRERLLGERIPLQQSISSWVARERLPLILNGEIQDERFVALWPRSEIRSAVSVPMQVANKLVGIINLNVINRLRPFTLGQMKALTILASTAAAALESASLFAQVQQAETNYRSIFENAVEGIFRSTADRRFITVNPALAQILGYESPEEVVSSFSDIGQQLYVDPTRSAEVARSLKQRGVVHGFEVEAYRKDGRKIWISLNIRVVRDEQGVEICREGTFADITERKRAEDEQARLNAEIESQRQRLKNIVTNVPGVVWEAWGQPDASTQQINFVSDYVETMLGYSVDEWLSTPNFWRTIVHPDDREEAGRLASECFNSGKGTTQEFRWLTKDGNAIWVESNYAVIKDAEGRSVGLRGVTIDITERKGAEEALRQSESKLVEAQRLAHIGSWNWDLQQDVVTWSDEHYRIFGVERGDIDVNCVEEVFDFIHPEDRELVRSMVAKTSETKEPFNFYYRIVRRDGEERIIQSSGSIETDGQGQPIRMFGTAQDVTERRRIEQELRQSEERYRLLFQSNPFPMWLYDLETLAFLTVNDAAIHHYGYSREEFLSMTIKDIRPSEDVPALLENVSRVSGGIDEAGSWRHQKKDGQIINVEITSHKLTFAGRRAELVLANDVTERRRVEEMRMRRATQAALRADVSAALAESEVPLRRTLERCSEAMVQHLGAAFARIWTLNQEENVLELQASAGVYTHIDGPHARVPVGKFKIGLIAEERQPHITNDVQTDPRVSDKEWAKREGMIAFAGYPLLVEDRLVGVLAMFSRQRLAEDTLDALASVAEIISQGIERKRAEEALSKSQERYRDLVENAHDIIYSHDLNGNYTSMNLAGQQITGYTRVEALALNLSQTVAPEDLPKAREMLAQRLAGESVTAYEMEIIAKDGHRVAVEVNTKLVLHDGVVVGVQGIARDVTERKRMEEALRASEEQLRQSQKLEAVGQLAGGVAHDFNNLLTVIGGYSSIVLGKLPPESPHRSSIEEIKKASDRASALTRQLLAFSRKQILQPKVLDLNLVVTDLEKMVRRLIGEDIDLLTLTDPLLGRVKADPGQLEQVLLNLIVNARDAMPKGGRLTIETGNVMLSEEYAERHAALAGRYVLLAVSDTGCGMDANIQPRVFEPFFTTKASGKGTGLGLATVYGIVKQSGGNIWVYSEVGRGSTFKIYLPRVDDISADEELVAAKSVPQGTETVLLVEDEDQVRAILKHILEDQGYQVLSASNGEEALAISEDLQRDIKLMVTDVVMPQMSGRELAERVLRIRPSLPVLFMSGYTDDAIVRHGLLDEKLNFIQKPFDSASVARKVREVLDAHS